MARKSAKDESEQLFNKFLEDTTAGLMKDITKTRQMTRRREFLNQLDALDLIKAKFYDWLHGLDAA